MSSKIEWCDAAINPVTGCTKISPGCLNCYAERQSLRLMRMGQAKYANGFDVTCHPDVLDKIPGGKDKVIFVCSMSDLFHEDVPFEFILKVFAFVMLNPWHRFLMLTKRPDRMREFYDWWRDESTRQQLIDLQVTMAAGSVSCIVDPAEFKRANDYYLDRYDQSDRGVLDTPVPWPLPNLALGVTVESPDYLWRIDKLLQCPAAMRFVSVEPMLSGLDLTPYLPHYYCMKCGWKGLTMPPDPKRAALKFGAMQIANPNMDYDEGCAWCPECGKQEVDKIFGGLDWVICGGESGPGARPMHPDWARGLRDQCVAAGVSFMLKQWGEWAPVANDSCPAKWNRYPWKYGHGKFVEWREPTEQFPNCTTRWSEQHFIGSYTTCARVGKKIAGRTLDGKVWDERPDWLKGGE